MALLAYDIVLPELFLYTILDLKSSAKVRIRFLNSTSTVFFIKKKKIDSQSTWEYQPVRPKLNK